MKDHLSIAICIINLFDMCIANIVAGEENPYLEFQNQDLSPQPLGAYDCRRGALCSMEIMVKPPVLPEHIFDINLKYSVYAPNSLK